MPETQSTSAGATAAAPFALKPRLDRFFPLRDAFSCVGSEFLDVIVWIPPGRADGSLRLWLKTEAQTPEIQISGKRFRPVARSKQ
ncbi:MAG: hypothetical protein FJ272_12390, partial [Planctomycetes bacterium]|nr:hypothetical protein [Planctomycetota bacterium]